MDGSKLARGERSAAFNVEGSGEEIHDLKTLTREQFEAKYLVDLDAYPRLIEALNKGEEIPRLTRVTSTVSREVKPGDVVQMPPKFKAEVKVPAKVSYKADCRGENVLVIRVEREHSSQLIIPESAKSKSDIGRVAAIGPQATRCKEGELILFDRFAAHGKEIELVDEQGIPRQHLLLNDVDVLLGLRRFVPAASELLLSDPELSESRTTPD